MVGPLLLLALAGLPLAATPPGGALRSAVASTYFVSPSGNDANPGTEAAPWRTIQRAAGALAPGDTVLIRAGRYFERVVPAASGSPAAEIVYAAYPGEAPVIDGTGVSLPDGLAGLFEVHGLGHVRVRGLRVEKSGPGNEHAGFLVEDSHHVVLEGNTTHDTRSSGIGVWGSQSVTLDGNEVTLACNGGQQEAISVAGTSDFVVTGNRVHDGASSPIGGEGITVKDGSHGGVVRGNRVWGLQNRLGIYVDGWDKHTFDVEIDGNVVHENPGGDGIVDASEMGGLVENVRVTNNLVWGNGLRGLVVASYGGVPTHPIQGLVVVNNTFVGNGTSGWGGGIAVDDPDVAGIVLRNNVVSGNLSFQIVVDPGVPPGEVTVDHNLVDGFRGDPGETRGTDFVEGDPLFVAPAANDYRLSGDSPALDRGNPVLAPPFDLDRRLRPQGSGFDLGAFERQAPAPCATSLFTLPPCRLLDTRAAPGPRGGPALGPGETRSFTVTGVCGIPAGAEALAVNATVTQPAAAGDLVLYRGDLAAPPIASSLSFPGGVTRASNGILKLAEDGSGTFRVTNRSAGGTHFLVDVSGIFVPTGSGCRPAAADR